MLLTDTTIGGDGVTLTCCRAGCGISFAVPRWWDAERRRDHTFWYCPNGHSQYFPTKSDVEKERERANRAEVERDVARRRAEYHQQRAEAETRRSVALKGVVTRTKKRIAAGKCPCCRERFPDLKAHIGAEHPGYADAMA
jgi:hypothetical protein